MTAYKPKNKLARREGVDLSLKTFGTKSHASLLKRLSIVPGFKSVRRKFAKVSDYGRQLREKQKLKRIYNVTEKKMSLYFDKAVITKGNTAEFLIRMLENRLDNVVFRLHLAPTRAAARQLVAHGHVSVNGKKIGIPSYNTKVGDKVEFGKAKSLEIPYIKEFATQKNVEIAKWLKKTGNTGEVVADIQLSDYQEPVDMALVIEFYSKL
jgi:small subunit ribosomal protein S4